MLAIGIVAFAFGFSFPQRWLRHLLRWSVASVHQSTCSELNRARRLPRAVAVLGLTAPGRAGLLTSPLSGTPCVWYHIRVGYWDDSGRRIEGSASRHGPWVAMGVDDGTDRVLLAPGLLDAPVLGTPEGLVERWPVHADPRRALGRLASDPSVADSELAARLRSRHPIWVEEVIVRAGQPVVVVGTPRRSKGVVTIRPRVFGWSGLESESLAALADRLEQRANDFDYLPVSFLGLPGIFLIAGALMVIFKV
jgi:hypothetical protein